MHRLWPLLLLLLLQPRTAAAEQLAYGYLAYVAPRATPSPPERPRSLLLQPDGMDPGASMRCMAERSDRAPAETASRVGPRLRSPRPSLLARPSAALHAEAWSPHCERLPYHATAPPLR
jgi:hypothetical protein